VPRPYNNRAITNLCRQDARAPRPNPSHLDSSLVSKLRYYLRVLSSTILAMLSINRRIQIPLSELNFTFARSGGPGGQNVNKVNSKAILRWPVVTSPSLSEDIRSRFLQKYAHRMTGSGDFVLTSQRYRDQDRNIDDCLEKLREMIAAVAVPPVPRRATKPTHTSKQRRVQAKREISQKKQERRSPALED
jgi:ribosome-associated protein